MSCIIGLKHGTSIYIGSDSAATTEDGDIRPIKSKKIFRKNNFLIGYAGSIRTGQILDTELFNPPDDINGFVEELRNTLIEAGCMVTSDGVMMLQSCFIVVHNGILYEILSDLQLSEIEGLFTAIGSGSHYAFGALDVLYSNCTKPKEIISKALIVVSRYQSTVRGPWIIEEY